MVVAAFDAAAEAAVVESAALEVAAVEAVAVVAGRQRVRTIYNKKERKKNFK